MNVLVVVALFAILSTGSVAFAAGGGQLGGNINFSQSGMSFSSHLNQDGDNNSGYASFQMSLNPDTMSLEHASWNFRSESYDPMYWTAQCYLFGYRNGGDDHPVNQNWDQNVTVGEVSVSESLNLYAKYDEGVPTSLWVGGSFNLHPAQIRTSSFSYREFEQTLLEWPNGHDHDPIEVKVPAWQGSYYLYGEFVADTPELARAMGAPFVQSVPEPTSFALMLCGIAVAVLRRRQRN